MPKFTKICTIGLTVMTANFGIAAAADLSIDERVAQASGIYGQLEAFSGKFHLSGDALSDGEADQARFAGGAVKMGVLFGGGWLALGEFFGESTTAGGYSDSYASGWAYSGHLAYISDAWLLGGFGGKIHTDQDDDDTVDSNRYFLGLEGQYYWDNFTLYAHGGWLDGTGGEDDNGRDSLRETWFGRIEARYFLEPNTMVNGYFAYGHGIMDDDAFTSSDPDEDVNVTTWGVGAEHRFDSTNIAAYANYEHSNYYQGSDEFEDIDEHT